MLTLVQQIELAAHEVKKTRAKVMEVRRKDLRRAKARKLEMDAMLGREVAYMLRGAEERYYVELDMDTLRPKLQLQLEAKDQLNYVCDRIEHDIEGIVADSLQEMGISIVEHQCQQSVLRSVTSLEDEIRQALAD